MMRHVYTECVVGRVISKEWLAANKYCYWDIPHFKIVTTTFQNITRWLCTNTGENEIYVLMTYWVQRMFTLIELL